MAGERTQVHGTCVAIDGKCALLRGDPGAGKSDLALRFLAMFSGKSALGVGLVSDDQTVLSLEHGKLIASSPAIRGGLIEVRGLGIISIAACSKAELALVVDLAPGEDIERFPDPLPKIELLGVSLPCIKLAAFEASAAIKLKIALTGGL